MVDGTNGFQRALRLVLLPTYPRESEMKTKVRNLGDLPKNTWRTQPQLIISNDLFGDLWLYIYIYMLQVQDVQTNKHVQTTTVQQLKEPVQLPSQSNNYSDIWQQKKHIKEFQEYDAKTYQSNIMAQ